MSNADPGETTLTASVAGVTKSVTTFVYAGGVTLNIVAFGGDAPPTPADCPDDLTSAVIDGNSQQPVSGATVQLLQATSGQPFSPAISAITATDGSFLLLVPPSVGLAGIEVSQTGYLSSYYWGPIGNMISAMGPLTILSTGSMGQAEQQLGVTFDPTKAIVVGGVGWTNGPQSQAVACATATSQVPGDSGPSGTTIYMDGQGNPAAGLSGTNGNNGQFLIVNADPGAPAFIAAQAGGYAASTTVPYLFAGGITWLTVMFSAPLTPNNPTPPNCAYGDDDDDTTPLDDDDDSVPGDDDSTLSGDDTAPADDDSAPADDDDQASDDDNDDNDDEVESPAPTPQWIDVSLSVPACPQEEDNDLWAVWGSSSADVFAVGGPPNGAPVIWHYDGSAWSNMYKLLPWSPERAPSTNLLGVWGSSSSDVYAVGGYELPLALHYDGSAWSPITPGNTPPGWLNGVWGASSSNLYAVGGAGAIYQYGGSPPSWTLDADDDTSPEINGWRGVWGHSPTDVFVVGGDINNNILISYGDGASWTAFESLPDKYAAGSLNSVWGSAAADVFAVGGHGTILVCDGPCNGTSSWSEVTAHPPSNSPPTTHGLNGVWGSSASDVFVVGDEEGGGLALILHCDGSCDNDSSWSLMTIPNVDKTLSSGASVTPWLGGVWGTSPSDVWAVGQYGTILHYTNDDDDDNDDDTAWSEMASGTTANLIGVWGSSPSDVYAVGAGPDNGVALHYDGSSWSNVESCNTTGPLNAVWGSSPSAVFVAGDGALVYQFDGSGWTPTAGSGYDDWNSVWGSSSSDVFVVGRLGSINHWDGSSWSGMTTGGPGSLNGVWESSSSDVFAVGYDPDFGVGQIYAYDRLFNKWPTVADCGACVYVGIWGSSASDVFVVGFENTDPSFPGIITHYDGSEWPQPSAPIANCPSLFGVWGSSPSDVFAVGGDVNFDNRTDVILHYDGASWSPAGLTGIPQELRGVWGSSSSDVFVVGGGGTILHYAPNP